MITRSLAQPRHDVETAAETLVSHSDGPGYWSHAARVFARGFLLTLPLVSVLGGAAVYAATQTWDWIPPVIFACLVIGMVGLVALLVPTAQANFRRRRDVLLGQLACSSSAAQARVSWTAWLVDSGRRYDGSLHLARGVVRFLWHQAATLPVLDPRSELVFEVQTSAIAAIETEPAQTLGEWWRFGSPLVLLILHDGRRVRLGAVASEELAQALRDRIGKPEGTPVAPSPADFPLEEIGRALVGKHRLVALVVKDDAGVAPFVVLHGDTEDLRGALESARDALLQERKALAPYAKGLLPAEPRPKSAL